MPPFHAGGLQQILAHMSRRFSDGHYAWLGTLKVSHQPHGAYYQLSRALYLGVPYTLIFEEVRVEQHPQGGANVVPRGDEGVSQDADGLGILGRDIFPARYLDLVGDKKSCTDAWL